MQENKTNIPMTFEEFKKYIDYLEHEYNFLNELHGLFRKYDDVVPDAEAPLSCAQDLIISLLEKIWKSDVDIRGYSDISYWCLEQEFGKKCEEYYAENEFLPENHKYRFTKLHNTKELYDYLVWDYNYRFGNQEK